MLLLKAQVKGSDQADLFGQTTQVHAHVRDGRIVRPYLAIRHKAPPAAPLPEVHVHPAKPMMVVTKQPHQIIGDWVAALLAGEEGDMAAAAAALGVTPANGLPYHTIARLRAFLGDKMPKAAIDRIATKEGMSLTEWVAAVKAERFKPKPVVVHRGPVAPEMAAEVSYARAKRDRIQGEYKEARAAVKVDPVVRQIGGIASSKWREARLGREFRSAQEDLRSAKSAVATRVAKPAGPQSYPWESASQSHLIHRMTDDELVSAMMEAVKTPRSMAYLDMMRISTKGRRDSLPLERNQSLLATLAHAETAAREAEPKPVLVVTKPAAKPVDKPEWKMTVEDLDPAYRARKYGDLTMDEFLRQAQLHEAIGAATDAKPNPQARKAAFEKGKALFNPGAYRHMHPSSAPTEPPHLAEGRRIYEGYKAKKAARSARGLGDSLGTASDEHSFALWEKRLAADPSKWKPGMGVSYQVSGGARMQTNRGFRLVSVDAAGKRGVVRSVADTGITTTGGDHDRLDDAWIYLGELKREKKYDAQ